MKKRDLRTRQGREWMDPEHFRRTKTVLWKAHSHLKPLTSDYKTMKAICLIHIILCMLTALTHLCIRCKQRLTGHTNRISDINSRARESCKLTSSNLREWTLVNASTVEWYVKEGKLMGWEVTICSKLFPKHPKSISKHKIESSRIEYYQTSDQVTLVE